MQNLERMRELIQTINEADEAYYKYDAPIMADLDYDRLYDELVALERETGTILSSSPTQRVSGEVLESLTAVRHTRPMLSADKCKSVADIHKYLGGHEAVLSWKLDGLTLVLRYGPCPARQRQEQGAWGTGESAEFSGAGPGTETSGSRCTCTESACSAGWICKCLWQCLWQWKWQVRRG